MQHLPTIPSKYPILCLPLTQAAASNIPSTCVVGAQLTLTFTEEFVIRNISTENGWEEDWAISSSIIDVHM